MSRVWHHLSIVRYKKSTVHKTGKHITLYEKKKFK